MRYSVNESKILGVRLKKIRGALGITQREMAQKTMVNSQKISEWERGERLIPLWFLLKLSRVFGISLDKFDIYGEKKVTVSIS